MSHLMLLRQSHMRFKKYQIEAGMRKSSKLLNTLKLVCFCLGIAILTGCAAQLSYREGRDLAERGQGAAALVKFEEAANLDKGGAQYRIAVLQTREALVNAALLEGEAERLANRSAGAISAFNRVLAIQPNNSRAIEGLKAIDDAKRHGKWLALAQTAIDKKDTKESQLWLRMIILENPQHVQALALMQLTDVDAPKIPSLQANTLASAYRKPITIEFKDAQLKTVFEVLSRSSGLNFILDKDIRADQKTSIFLKNSTIEAALNLTLLTNQLEQRTLDANTVMIYPNTQIKQKDYQPLVIKSFYLANAEAKNVAATLKSLLKTRDVVVDDKLNLLIVRDSPEAIRLAEKLVALHDVREAEVMLEVEVLEVKRTRLMDLGIRWPDQLSLAPLPSTTGGLLNLLDLKALYTSATTKTPIDGEKVSATIGGININAKKVDTDANILANPRIRVRNREKAKILIGERVPNITTTSTSTGFVSESVNYVDVGLKLDVEPTIYVDSEVGIKISLEVSNIISQLQTKSGSIAYQIGTRTAQTVLRLKDGENQILAGLISNEERSTGNKIPGLGDIPIAGRLFGNQADDGSRTEIVLSITPRILRNIQRLDAATMEFDAGTENSLGGRVTSGGVSQQNSQSVVPSQTAPAPALNTPIQSNLPTASPVPDPSLAKQNPVNTSEVPTPAAAAQIKWQGPTQIKVGDVFAVQLVMQADQPVVSIPLAIGFDTKTLQITSVSEGEFLKQGGAQTSFASRVDPSGQILITGTRSGETGATSPGVFATINLKAIAANTTGSRMQLLTISPVVLGGKSINAPAPAPHLITISP
jgi:general secretion pathway protein D